MGQANTAQRPTAEEYYRRTQALLPNDRGNPRFITQPRDFNETVRKLADSGACILLCAIRYIDYIPPVQAISFRIYEARQDDWYKPHWGDGKLALKGQTLTGLFRDADGSYLRSERLDARDDSNLWHFSGRVVLRAMNGRDLVFSKDRLLDLRPGAPELEAMKDRSTGKPQEARRAQARQAGAMVCETKAQLRAIRAALGVQQAYSQEDTIKPFVLPVLVPNPDMTNPQHAAFMLAHATGNVEQLYGRRALPPPPTIEPETAIEPGSGDRYHVASGEVIDGEVVGGPEPEDHDFGDFPSVAPSAPRCTCPCGCSTELVPEVARMTTERGGSPRCGPCWPSASFDYERHQNLGDLGLTPATTPLQAKAIADRQKPRA